MAKRVCVIPVHVDAVATGQVTVNTSSLSDISIITIYDETAAGGAGNMTFYGCLDSVATNVYLLGVRPMLTGTVDADAVIQYTADNTYTGYMIDGVHQYISLLWTETGDTAHMYSYVVGLEDI